MAVFQNFSLFWSQKIEIDQADTPFFGGNGDLYVDQGFRIDEHN